MSACGAIIAAWFISAWAPPPEYDYPPRQEYKVRAVPCSEIPRLCKGYYVACTLPHHNLIYVDERLLSKRDWFDKAVRHEKAHLNGWRH